jgi:hypothetical protein
VEDRASEEVNHWGPGLFLLSLSADFHEVSSFTPPHTSATMLCHTDYGLKPQAKTNPSSVKLFLSGIWSQDEKYYEHRMVIKFLTFDNTSACFA